VEVTITVYFVI